MDGPTVLGTRGVHRPSDPKRRGLGEAAEGSLTKAALGEGVAHVAGLTKVTHP